MRFAVHEGGAVTTDFVILSAGVIMLALSFGATFGDGLTSVLDAVNNLLSTGAAEVDGAWM